MFGFSELYSGFINCVLNYFAKTTFRFPFSSIFLQGSTFPVLKSCCARGSAWPGVELKCSSQLLKWWTDQSSSLSVPTLRWKSHVSDFYIPRIGPHISCNRLGRSIVWIYKSLKNHMSAEIGTLATQFLFWEYLFWFSVLVLCSASCVSSNGQLMRVRHFWPIVASTAVIRRGEWDRT